MRNRCPVCSGKRDAFASTQKLLDLLPVRAFGVLHLYLHSAAYACLPRLSIFRITLRWNQVGFQDHLVLDNSAETNQPADALNWFLWPPRR